MTIIGTAGGGGIVKGAASLTSMLGYVPANLNMLPWGANAQVSDFTNSTNFSFAQASIKPGIVSGFNAEAQHLTESSSNSTHFVTANSPQTGTFPPIPHRLAVIARASERSRIVVFFQNFEDHGLTTSVGFDLAGGNVGYDNSVGADATLDAATMTNLGNGWWLCVMDVHYTSGHASSGSLVWTNQINLDNGSGTAARSISYQGNGTSGVDIFWFNMLPVEAWSLKTLTFQDDFTDLSTIDLNDTRNPGYKWYTHNLWPTSYMPTFGWATNPPSAPTPSSYLSISSPSVLKIYNPNTAPSSTAGYTSQLWSTADDGAGGYVGTAWKGPFVQEALIAYDGTYNPNFGNISGWPAIWMMPVEALTNNMGGQTHFTENDTFESGFPDNNGNSGSSGGHDWSNPSSPVDHGLAGGHQFKKFVLGEFHRVSTIWINSAASGTTWGFYIHFLDGQYLPNFSSWPYNTATSDFGTGGDGMTYTFIMDTGENKIAGGGWAMYVDWVKMWTT